MNQLIEPTLPGKGYLARCLGYVQGVYGVPEKRYSDDIPWAMQVWEHSDQHTGLPPSDVKVPLWFSWSGTVDGVYRNWGHVVINVPGVGLYSSPMLKGENYHIFNSIQSVENFLGAKYLGWSTDVYNVKVVGESMGKWDNGKTFNLLFKACNQQIAERAQKANYVGYFGLQDGMDAAQAFDDIVGSPQFDFLVDEARKAAQSVTYVPVTEQLYKKG